MYMKDVFSDNPALLSSLKWNQLGFSGKDGNDSTIWLGTEGAHTVCHYDTYGYNVVLQVTFAHITEVIHLFRMHLKGNES